MATKNEDLTDMTVSELHDKAKEAGLTGTSHMKKEELIEALQNGDASKASETHAEDGRKRDDKGHFEKTDTNKAETKASDTKASDSKHASHGDGTDRARDDKGHFVKDGDTKK